MSDQRQIFYVDRRLPTTVLEETINDAVAFLKGAVLGAGGTAVGQIRLTANYQLR